MYKEEIVNRHIEAFNSILRDLPQESNFRHLVLAAIDPPDVSWRHYQSANSGGDPVKQARKRSIRAASLLRDIKRMAQATVEDREIDDSQVDRVAVEVSQGRLYRHETSRTWMYRADQTREKWQRREDIRKALHTLRLCWRKKKPE